MAASGAWGGGIGLAIEVEPNSALRVFAGANGSDGLVELITPSSACVCAKRQAGSYLKAQAG